MNIEPETPTPAGPSALFPDITLADYAGWVEQAKALSTPSLTCDADDVILAAHLLGVGEHIVQTGDPGLRTSAVRKLFNSKDPIGLRSLVCLAKFLRRQCPVGSTGFDLACAGQDMVTTLTTVLVTVAPDRKAMKHPKG
jgi:hypothetical protein